jgi:glutamate racemase
LYSHLLLFDSGIGGLRETFAYTAAAAYL